MGINKLLSNLKKDFPKLITPKTFKDLKSSSFIIDSSIYFYKFTIAMRYMKQGNPSIVEFKDKEGNKTAHIIGLVSLARNLLKNKIKPIFVIDGAPDVIKAATVY